MISQTSEYALRAAACLVKQETPFSRTEIAAQTQIPIDYLHKVLKQMERAGIVRSRPGPNGGYWIETETIRQLTVLDVIQVVSEIPRIKTCPLGISDHMSLCPLHRLLDNAAESMELAFASTMLVDLVDPHQTENCSFPIT